MDAALYRQRSRLNQNRLAQYVRIVYMHLRYIRPKSGEFQNTTYKDRAIVFRNRDERILIKDLTAEALSEDAEDQRDNIFIPLRSSA